VSKPTLTDRPGSSFERACDEAERECLASLRGRWNRLRGDLEGVVQRHPKTAVAASASLGAVVARLASRPTDPDQDRAPDAGSEAEHARTDRRLDSALAAGATWIAAWLPTAMRLLASRTGAAPKHPDSDHRAAPTGASPSPSEASHSEALS